MYILSRSKSNRYTVPTNLLICREQFLESNKIYRLDVYQLYMFTIKKTFSNNSLICILIYIILFLLSVQTMIFIIYIKESKLLCVV